MAWPPAVSYDRAFPDTASRFVNTRETRLRSISRKIATALPVLALSFCVGAAVPAPERDRDVFLWGVSTSVYQVEGGYQVDGKGLSNWDVYTNEFQVTKPVIGRKETGNVADNLYDRQQYLRDIAFMKRLGINSYRFSIAWSRILPEGTGEVNQAGLAHYRQLIDDLIENGIEPVVTIYHWDMPEKLAERGGWANPASVDWYEAYAEVIFRAFGDRVRRFITVNEPFVELFMIEPSIHRILEGVADEKSGASRSMPSNRAPRITSCWRARKRSMPIGGSASRARSAYPSTSLRRYPPILIDRRISMPPRRWTPFKPLVSRPHFQGQLSGASRCAAPQAQPRFPAGPGGHALHL